MEMGRLSQERKRLGEEMAHWDRRIQQIKQRLGEIAQAEEWLRGFIGQADLSETSDSGSCPQLPEQKGRGQKRAPAIDPSDLREITVRY